MLCQLSYARLTRTGLFLARLFMDGMPPKFFVVLLELKPFRTLCLFRDSVVPQSGFRALQPNVFTCHLLFLDSNATRDLLVPDGKNLPTSQTHRTSPGDEIVNYSRILVTTPEPTVLPPSRIAKRTFSTIAIGLPSVTCILTLSPGMHISAPPSSDDSPVTSVVRK